MDRLYYLACPDERRGGWVVGRVSLSRERPPHGGQRTYVTRDEQVTTERTSPAAGSLLPPRQTLSLERKLPLFMTGVLGLGLALALALTYATMADSAKNAASDRLQRAVRQLAELGVTSTTRLKGSAARVASDARVVEALGRAQSVTDSVVTDEAARQALGTMLLPTDTLLSVELWSADGRRIAHVGRDTRAAGEPRVGDSANPQPPAAGQGLEGLEASDSARIGSLYASGDRVYFWLAAPVISNGRRLGYVAQRREIRGGEQVQRTLRELYGGNVTAYYRDVDRPVWVTIAGEIAAPSEALDSSGSTVVVRRAGTGRLLSASARIAGTPLAIVLEAPLRDALAPARRSLRRLAAISLAILLAGAVLSWGISRRITRPLVSLTSAAESLAAGNYDARVETKQRDEIGRLASSFNRMAEQIGASHEELALQTEEAQATTEELSAAMQEVEEREAQFRALADAIPQLTWMANPDGGVFWYNKRWYQFTGTTPEQMMWWGWKSVHDPEMLPAVLEGWRASLASGEPFEMEFPLRGANGEFRWFLTRVEPVKDRDGRVARWFGTSTDVQALRDAREGARSASTAKSEFLTTMSHELRTPLNAIGGYVELLEMELRGPITPEQRRDLDRIKASQEHLLGLIGGMLDLSRIESGTVTYQLNPIALDPFLAGLDALVAPQAAAKSLELDYQPCGPDVAVLADREKLRQVLLNLLSNAIRFTPAGGRVMLSAEAHGAEQVAIMVHDTGPGIPEDKLGHIFEPFVQLDRSLSQPREGIGLGLAISRDLAHGMGGELWVESDVGKGSCFTITLPRAAADSVTPATFTGELPVVTRLS